MSGFVQAGLAHRDPLAGFSDADRRAVVRGEGLPSHRRQVSRVIRGVSQEADELLTLLRRAGGARSVGSLRSTSVSGYVDVAARELAELGLVAPRPALPGRDLASEMIRLTPKATGVMLVGDWSRR